MQANDPKAMFKLGVWYFKGRNGFPQNYTKAFELLHQAAELGLTEVYNNIGSRYYRGEGVEVDKKKSVYCYEQAAIGGDSTARCNLGNKEARAGNMERATKHFILVLIRALWNFKESCTDIDMQQKKNIRKQIISSILR